MSTRLDRSKRYDEPLPKSLIGRLLQAHPAQPDMARWLFGTGSEEAWWLGTASFPGAFSGTGLLVLARRHEGVLLLARLDLAREWAHFRASRRASRRASPSTQHDNDELLLARLHWLARVKGLPREDRQVLQRVETQLMLLMLGL